MQQTLVSRERARPLGSPPRVFVRYFALTREKWRNGGKKGGEKEGREGGKGNWEHGKGVRACESEKGRGYRRKEGSSSRDVREKADRERERERRRGTGRYAARNILEYLRNLVAGH